MSIEKNKVPPDNNNKGKPENVLDGLISDDWMDYDVNESGDENNRCNTSEITSEEATEEIPPKTDSPCSEVSATFSSPKNKKRKLPDLKIDEQLKNMKHDILYMNFTKLLLFLESNSKELTFPFIMQIYEELFTMIVSDMSMLKSSSFDKFRVICDKIINAASGYTLTYTNEYIMDFQKIVMVVRKEHNDTTNQSEEETSSFSDSTESVPSSQTSTEVTTQKPPPSLHTVPRGFKAHFLSTTLAFIKNDLIKTKEFPELSSDQVCFMQMLLERAIAFTGFDCQGEAQELYRALCEAIRIYSLKYVFRINCHKQTWAGKNSLEIEKIPKQKAPGTTENSNQTMNLKRDVSAEATKPEPRPDVSEPWFAMPKVVGQRPVKKPVCHTKRNLKKIIKLKNETILLKELPPNFILATLNTIHEFLVDDQRFQLVVEPKTFCELQFYRICIDWCRLRHDATKISKECKEMQYQISLQLLRLKINVPKGSENKSNRITGLKNVTYQKVLKGHSGNVQRTPTKKVNLQNALELAETENVQLGSVINLNRSNTPSSTSGKKSCDDESSSSCSSRATSRDRSNASAISQYVPKRPANEIIRNTLDRNEKLKEALSVPVQSDKAIRMMRGMGWSGGALGARGDGITVPIMPELDIGSSRAGFGHSTYTETITKKAIEPITSFNWVSECVKETTEGNNTVNDVIVQMKQQLILENHTTDAKMTITELPKTTETNVELRKPTTSKVELSKPSGSNVELPKPTTSNVELSQPTTSNVELSQPTTSNVELSKPTTSNVELSKPTTSNVELSKPTTSNVELSKPTTSNVELSKPTTSNVELSKPTTSNVELSKPTTSNVELSKPTTSNAKLTKPRSRVVTVTREFRKRKAINAHLLFRQEILHSILDLLNADATCKTLTYEKDIPYKGRQFVSAAVQAIKRGALGGPEFGPDEHDICREIQNKYKALSGIVVDSSISFDYKTITLTKRSTEFAIPEQQETFTSVRANTEIITEEDITSYIQSSGSSTDTLRAYEMLKFRVLFLFNILNFVKSNSEEVEITFNMVLAPRQKIYIHNVVDEVNMRIQFGSSPAETKLCEEIKKHVNGAFLAAIFNHQYTSVTLNKYFRFKRLNRPDSAVSCTSQTSVDLDCFSSETITEAKFSTGVLTDDESNNTVTEDDPVGRRSQTSVDLDWYSSETSIKAKLSTNKPFNDESSIKVAEDKVGRRTSRTSVVLDWFSSKTFKDAKLSTDKTTDEVSNKKVVGDDNKVPEDNNDRIYKAKGIILGPEGIVSDPYDSESSSIEEYMKINSNISVPKLLPGEEAVDVSDFVHLYDKANPNKTCINNDSDTKSNSNMTENNIGNENIVIDNNDNQVTDMDGDDDIPTDTDVTMDEDENYAGRGRNIVLVFTAKTIKYRNTKLDIKNAELKNVKDSIQNDQPEKHGDDNIDKVIDTVLGDNVPQDEIKDVCKDPAKNANDIKEDLDVTMKESYCMPMEVISETEESLVEINKEDNGQGMKKGESEAGIKHGESIEVTNPVESSTDVEAAQIEETHSINPSDNQNAKGDNNLNIKTNCDIISKGNIVLGEDNCDTQNLGLRHVKSVGTGTDGLNKEQSEIKNVRITHAEHPDKRLNKSRVLELQTHISQSIMPSQLPLLKCHGVQNGTIIYTCYNKSSYDWLQNTLSTVLDVKMINAKEVTKVILKINGFFDFDHEYLFKMIELYNHEISTKDWVVESTETFAGYVVFVVRVDKFSINFIQASNYTLHAGVDEVQFSFKWENEEMKINH